MFPESIIRHPLLASLLVLVLSLVSLGHTSAADAITSERTILVLGDSLSAGYGIKKEEGWVTLLDQKIKAEGYSYHIINASISGETTEGGLSRLPALLTKHRPDFLLIELGANDGLRGFPIKLMNNNLSTMIELAKKQRARVLLIGIQLPLNYGPRYRQLFEETFTKVSHKEQTPLATSLLGKIPADKALMQMDGLHPNAAAQPQLLNHVWPYLKPLLIK